MSAEIKLFGPLRVVGGGSVLGPRDFNGRKAKQVLQILALEAPRTVTKDRLACLLWDDAPPRDYDGCLEHYVSLVRRRIRGRAVVQAGMVVTEHRGYRLDESVRVDFSEWNGLYAAGSRARDGDLVERALALARADLLEDEPHAEWAMDAREEFRRRRLHLLALACELRLSAGDYAAAAVWAREATRVDPLNESAYRSLMTAVYAQGEQAEALRLFRILRQALATEVGVDPLPATVAIHRAVLSQAPVATLLPARPESPIVGSRRRPLLAATAAARTPLLGRAAELERLVRACAAHPAPGERAHPVVVEGGLGAGKSRLLDELAGRLGEERVLMLRTPLGAQHVRGGLIAELLSALAPHEAAPGRDILDGLDERDGGAVPLESIHQLDGLLSCRQWPAILVDDAQHADAMSLRLLHFLACHANRPSSALVFAADQTQLDPGNPLVTMAADRIRLGPLSAVELEPLGVDDMYSTTGGLPVLVAARLRAPDGASLALPADFRRAVFERIHAVDPIAMRVAVACAVVGEPCDPRRVAALLSADPLIVAELQELLCEIDVLASGPNGFAFRYAPLRAALRGTVTAARLELLERAAAGRGLSGDRALVSASGSSA